jgi:hypothetical protein
MANTKYLYNGTFNDYTIKPRNLAQYTSFRGVTDFSQIGKFNQYETGYQFLSVIQMPKYMVELGKNLASVGAANAAFRDMLECEFRGLDGLPDIVADTYEITDGINSVRMINRVTEDTSITVSSSYFEKQGSLIEKYSEYYLTGIKDPKSQAKTYHGLIKQGLMEPSLENEVFTLLFFATDNTMLRVERAVLLANAQLTKAEQSQYNGSRSDINNREVSIEFNCFPIHNAMVDKAAKALLEDITGVKVSNPTEMGTGSNTNTITREQETTYSKTSEGVNVTRNTAVLDSSEFTYSIMREKNNDGNANPFALTDLTNAIKN